MDKGKIKRIIIGNGLNPENFDSIDNDGSIYVIENNIKYKLNNFSKTIVKNETTNNENKIFLERNEEEIERIKNIKKTRGWHFRDEFIDSEGNVYYKGKLQNFKYK